MKLISIITLLISLAFLGTASITDRSINIDNDVAAITGFVLFFMFSLVSFLRYKAEPKASYVVYDLVHYSDETPFLKRAEIQQVRWSYINECFEYMVRPGHEWITENQIIDKPAIKLWNRLQPLERERVFGNHGPSLNLETKWDLHSEGGKQIILEQYAKKAKL